ERRASIRNDDMNRLLRAEAVAEERPIIVIDRAIERHTQAVIIWRKRQDLDLVNHFFYTLNSFDVGFSARLGSRPRHVSAQDDRAIRLHLEFEPIKNTVVRQRRQFM